VNNNTDHPLVQLIGVTKKFGHTVAVHPLELTIAAGDFLAILGPSGCGKTTLLNMIAGFMLPDSGTIEIDGLDVTRRGPERRPTNMVFLGYGLFPHMNVRQNVAYGLRLRKMPRAEIDQRVKEIIELVDLKGFEDRNVNQLSGGEMQRVALSRALIMRPKVLLLDEPLAALDLKLRKSMQEELRRIHQSIGGTFVYVTHDQEEAMSLANRIVIMQEGHLIQEGTAREIYDRPKTRFVSTFIGEANLFSGYREDDEVVLDIGLRFSNAGPDGQVDNVVRPESITISHSSEYIHNDLMALRGQIDDIIFLGPYINCRITAAKRMVTVLVSSSFLPEGMTSGSDVFLTWKSEDNTVIDGK
jgi:ABC-type Fe3+/spermidine/putrescine transport system ATPase subunit